MLKCHPDKVTDPAQKAAKQEEFQKVQKAYETLSNEDERQKYDDMVLANELEKDNAERRRQRDREFTPGRTPPRSYDSDYGRSPAHYTVHVNKPDSSYKVRTAEPREPPTFQKSQTWTSGSKSPYNTSTRTPPRSYEEMNHYSSYEDLPPRDSRESRRSRETSSYKEKISRHEEEKRAKKKEEEYESRRAEEKARRKEREKAERREAELQEAERKNKERRDKEKRKAEKARDTDRKRDTEEKRSRHKTTYAEEDSDPVVFTSKPDKKSKSSSRSKEVPVQIREDREHRSERGTKQDQHLNFAAQYLESSRSKAAPRLGRSQTYHYNPRDVEPPPPPPAVATPPPAAAGMAPPPPPMASMASRMYDVEEEDAEPIRRSSAGRRRMSDTPKVKEKASSSSHKKSSSGRDAEFVSEASRPATFKHANTMPMHQNSPAGESPPKLARAKTEFVRAIPGGVPRTSTWTAGDDERERSRSRPHQPRYDSEDESEEEVRPRRSHRTRSPEQMPNTFRYTVENGRAKAAPRTASYREESPPRRGKASYHLPESNTGRPLEHRPAMHSYDSYSSQHFPRVRTAKAYETQDVQYSDMPYTSRGEVYGYG